MRREENIDRWDWVSRIIFLLVLGCACVILGKGIYDEWKYKEYAVECSGEFIAMDKMEDEKYTEYYPVFAVTLEGKRTEVRINEATRDEEKYNPGEEVELYMVRDEIANVRTSPFSLSKVVMKGITLLCMVLLMIWTVYSLVHKEKIQKS